MSVVPFCVINLLTRTSSFLLSSKSKILPPQQRSRTTLISQFLINGSVKRRRRMLQVLFLNAVQSRRISTNQMWSLRLRCPSPQEKPLVQLVSSNARQPRLRQPSLRPQHRTVSHRLRNRIATYHQVRLSPQLLIRPFPLLPRSLRPPSRLYIRHSDTLYQPAPYSSLVGRLVQRSTPGCRQSQRNTGRQRHHFVRSRPLTVSFCLPISHSTGRQPLNHSAGRHRRHLGLEISHRFM